MEDLHQKVRQGQDVALELRDTEDLDVAQWTMASKTLFHAATEAGNLRALEQLILKVI